MAVEFCKKCGGLMGPKQLKTKMVIACRSCGAKREIKRNETFKLKERVTQKPAEEVVVMEKDINMETLPKARVQCPKCGHNEAHWWLQQTRSADEPPTRFQACTKCGHRWREYD